MESRGIRSDLTFGYFDKTKYKGDISWNPITFKMMFAVPFENILINGKPTNLCDGKHLNYKC